MHNFYLKAKLVRILGLILFITLPFLAQSQNLYSRSSGAWNTAGRWSFTGHAGASCNCTPGAGNTLIIGNNHDITIPSNTTVTFTGIIIDDDGNTGSLMIGNNTNTASTVTITGNITINGGGTLIVGGDGGGTHSLVVRGDITNAGTFDMVDGGDVMNVTFNGTAARTVDGNGDFDFNNITLNAGGNNVNISTSIRVNAVINFAANGRFVVGATDNITLSNAASITGYTANRYIELDGTTGANSQLIREGSSTANWQFFFPIGTGTGGYTPLDLTAGSGATITTAPDANSTLAVKAIYNASTPGQMRRTFRLVVNGNNNTTTFTGARFYYNAATDVSTGDNLSDYSSILYLGSPSGAWSTVIGTAPGATGYFTGPSTTSPLSDGEYMFTIGEAPEVAVWYSYQNGVWSNPDVWTLDPSGSSLINPLTQSPTDNSEVVILNGFTVTSDVNDILQTSVTIQGGATLDVAATTGHDFGTVKGSGLLRVNGSALPAGDYTDFVSTTGGTVEYYNTPGTLSTTQTTYNNLLLTNSTNGPVTFITASNLTVNNALTIEQTGGTGTVTWQINNTANNQRTLSIAGNLTVSANGRIRAGSGNEAGAPHELTLYGNLINNGSVKFFDDSDTELQDASYPAAVSVNELQGNAVNVIFGGLTNATATCNNQTDFYRLILDKGTGQQAMLTINSSDTDNFRLFGPNNRARTGVAPNYVSNNSLSILNGTLQLTGSIDIPVLIEDIGVSNSWPVPQNGALWLNGSNVTVQVATNTAAGDNKHFHLFGLLRITAGTFNLGYSRGLLGGGSGSLVMEGGTINAWQLRTTNLGTNNNFAYYQSGGTVNVGTAGLNGVTIQDYPRFALNYSTCTFQMTGGVLSVGNPTPGGIGIEGGIQIASSSNFYNVTGGTVNVYVPASDINFRITSTAPFYNLNIYKEGAGLAEAQLNSVSADDGNGTTLQPAEPLVVLNNLILNTGNTPVFNCNGNNLTIGGNLEIQTGTTLTPGANTITFNRTGANTWTNNNVITSLNNVVVEKGTGSITLAGSGTFPNMTGLTLTSGTLNDGGKTITVTSALSNSAVHTGTGSIVHNAAAASTIGGVDGTFGNLTIQTNFTVTNTGTQSVTGNLRLLGANTTLDIASNALTVLGGIFSNATTGVAFTATKRIQTSGLLNAGGLTRQATSGTDLLFPVGTSVAATAYTPATINATATTAGRITVRPVANTHPNVTTAGQSVRYFWRVTSTGFTGISAVTHKSYTYATATRDAASTNYRPARYDPVTLTWAYGPVYNATAAPGLTTIPNFNTATGWTGLSSAQLDGEYTAGNQAAFGAVLVYYSRASGAWNAATTWSNTAVGGPAAATAPPCATCPVVIGDGTLNHTITIDLNGRSAGSVFIGAGSVLNCGAFTGLNFGVNTSGTGTLRIGSANFPAGDFINFLLPGGGTVEWYGPSYTIPAIGPAPQALSLNQYNNLIVSPNIGATIVMPASNLTVHNNLSISGLALLGQVYSNEAAVRTIAVGNNLSVNSGTLSLRNNNVTNISVGGNTTVSIGASFAVEGGGGTLTHTLTTAGSITNNGTLDFDTGNEGVQVTFTGTTNTSITGTNVLAATTLDGVIVNKGTSQTPMLTIDAAGTVTAPSNNWLVLENGTVNFNKAATTFTLTNVAASPFTIPATSKLLVESGTVNISNGTLDDSDVLLSGTLEVAGGTVNIGNGATSNNDIEYSSAGTPSIIVSAGSLNVNGAVRRPTTTLAGALVYNQTGGTVTIGGIDCTTDPNNTRGIFEIENNTGSSFTLSGTSLLRIVRQTGGTQFADLYLNPASSSVSATSTIQVGDNALGARTLTINIVPEVGNFTVLGSTGNAQTVNMQSSELSVAGTLTINQASRLNTNALDVTIGGNLSINTLGTYDGTSNTTTFNGVGPQSGVLSASSTFQTITVDKPSGTVTLSGTSPTIVDLNILSGVLDVSTIGLTVTGDIVNNSSQIGTGSITLSGASTEHTITSSGGSFTNLTLGTGATTKTVLVNGNLTINGVLNFAATNRYLSIGSGQVTFGSSASVNGAGASAFIRTNGILGDLGVVRNWPTGTTTFTYPVGVMTYYTPVTFTLTASGAGNLTVVPVNAKHPTANIGSPEQILDYYWIVTRDNNLTYSTTGSHQYSFPSSLMSGSGGGLVAGYLNIASPTGWITSGHGGAATTTSMTYTNLLNSNLPSGGNTYHLTVGTVNTLPNPIVPVYSRLANASVSNPAVGGNWNDAASWTISSDGMGAALSAAPYGVPVVILEGARINTNVNGRQAFTSRIDGLLVVGTSYGHNIGAITGTGTLRTNTNTFPAGNYTGFVSSAGGTIEYVGPMTMNNRSTYNNVSIIGTGNVTMTNTDLILNGSMGIASGATLNNGTNNRNISLAGNWSNSGTFVRGTATVTFNGAATQTITGTTAFNNLTVSKAGGNLTLNGSGTTTVNTILALTNGNIVSSASHLLVLGSTATISGGGANSFVSGPMRKPIASGGSFAFPLGSVAADYYRPASLSNTSNADTWTLEYVGHNPSDDGYPNETMNTTNIAKVSMFEYWNIGRAGTASANVTITYNTGSYIPPDIGNVANLRVVRWDGTQWDLPPGAGSFSQSGTNITGTVTVTDVTSFSPFTFGSLDILSPLPVSWLYFTARRVDKNVLLNWKTALETNNHRFEIERSLNGTQFSRIGTISVNGANPNGKEYSFIDSEASLNAKYYYRIRQVDFDGVEDYSNIALVLPAGEVVEKRWVAYPNPMASDETFVLAEIDPVIENEVEVVMFSTNGTVVYRSRGMLRDLSSNVETTLQSAGAGMYLLQVSDGGYHENFRIVRY